MSKTGDIYKQVFLRLPAAIVSDNAVAETVNKEIAQRKQEGQALSEDDWKELIFFGCCRGQEEGFENGFKYALAMIFECLSS